MNLHAYTPATDTTELARVYRGPWFERETVEIPLLDLRPAVTRTYLTPRARLRRAGHRFMASDFARDVRSRLPLIPTVIGGLTVAYVLTLVVQTVALAVA